MLPKWLLDIRSRVPSKVAIPLGLLPVLAILIIWWALTLGAPEERFINRNILPSPSEVATSVFGSEHVQGLFQRHLFENLYLSLKRIALSYLLAVAVTLPLGILMGSFGSIRVVFAPATTASGYVPIVCLIPLTLSWFGIGESQKIFFLAMAFGISLLPSVIGAIDSVSDVYLKTASTLGASRWDMIARVLIPIALPNIWQGMRLAFGVGWTYLVLAEGGVILDGGLGDLVYTSQRRGPREHIYLIIILITLIAWVADILWTRLGDFLFPYRRPR